MIAYRVTLVIADMEFDGYQTESGIYAFSHNGCESLGIRPRNQTGKKYAQPLLEADPLYRNLFRIAGNNASVKLISLDTFLLICAEYAKIGNEKCIALGIACLGEALERRFDSAFGKVRTEAERNDRLKSRMMGKLARREFTDALSDYLKAHPELSDNARKFLYPNCSDAINKKILGCTAKKARDSMGVETNELLRDRLPPATLREIKFAEEFAMRLIDDDLMEPYAATQMAIKHSRVLGMPEEILSVLLTL